MPAFSLDALRPWNTHWSTGQVSNLVLRHPEARAPVSPWTKSLLDTANRQWQVVAGPRQIGKTTSLGHVAKGLIGQGVAPKRVAIVPLDQPAIQLPLEQDLGTLFEALTEQGAPSEERPLFLLIDELQDLDGWAQMLKAAWDRYHPTVRVLATGSSAMQLIRPAEADFPGRIRTSLMYPMKFREVLLGHQDKQRYAEPAVWIEIERRVRDIRALFLDPARHEELTEQLEELHGFLRSVSQTLSPFIAQVFIQYAAWGGYPAARTGTPRKTTERREVFEQAWLALLGKDAVAAGVTRPRDFGFFFHALGRVTGGKFVAENFSKSLGPKAETLSSWKRILEDAMLVQQLPPLKPNLRPSGGKDKAYLVDSGWHGYFRGMTDATQLDESALGPLVETVVLDHVRRLRFNLTGTTNLPMGYIESPEVDVAASLGNRWMLVEVKFTTQPKGTVGVVGDDTSLRIVTTRDHFDVRNEERILFLPASEFCLLC